MYSFLRRRANDTSGKAIRLSLLLRRTGSRSGIRFCLTCTTVLSGCPLPDPYPLARRQIQLLSRLYVKCRIPCVDIPHCSGAKLSRRMRVGHYLLSFRSLTQLLPPVLPECDEELLIA